jgi:type I restriction enzyme R subunit
VSQAAAGAAHYFVGLDLGKSQDHSALAVVERDEIFEGEMDYVSYARRRRRRYADPKAWETLGLEQHAELAREVAGLPSSLVDTDQDAKQFDLLMLQLQLAVLRADPGFAKLRKRVEAIAGLLSEKDAIPMVRAQMALIEELQTDEFWQDVTPAVLENVRKRLRSLLKLIDKTSRKPIYTDFEDEIGEAAEIELSVFTAGANFAKFRAKARYFLKEHEAHPVISKIRLNRLLTAGDLTELEQMLMRAGIGTAEDLSHAKQIGEGLGLFLRSLVGLDRAAAKAAFAEFLNGKAPTANQIEFINVIIDHLTDQGYMENSLLYGSPYIDFSPRGVDGLFASDQVTAIFSILDGIRQTAAA